MSRSSRRPVLPVAAAVLGVLLATAGCGVVLPMSQPVTRQPASSTRGSSDAGSGDAGSAPAADPQQAGPGSAQLAAALPPIPAGSTQWLAKLGPFGALTAKQYVSATFGADQVATDLPIELQRGLRFGAVQHWIQPDGILVSVFLGRYSAHAGALSAFLVQRSGDQSKDGGDAHFTLPGIADSYAVETAQLDSVGNAQTNLHAVAGDVLIRVFVDAPGTPDRTTTTRVAEQAYAAVCKLTDCSTSGN